MIEKNQKPEAGTILLDLLTSMQSSMTSTQSAQSNLSIAQISRFIPETIITQYTNLKDPTLLERQLRKLQIFIENNIVQTAVASDFDKGNFRVFDPSNGDNGCESRVSLLEIFGKKETTSYTKLTSEEKLFLTICHVLRLYKLDQRDLFGLLIYEKHNAANLKYGDRPVVKISNANITPKGQEGKCYTAIDLMGHAMSNISVKFMASVDDRLNGSGRSIALTPYQRILGEHIMLPLQLKVEASFATMLTYIRCARYPLIYRITRMQTSLSSGIPQFSCQGIDFIVRIPENGKFRNATDSEIVELGDKPSGFFEMFSVKTEKQLESTDPELRELGNKATFQGFFAFLCSMDIEGLILKESQELDNKHSIKAYKSSSGLGNKYASAPRSSTELAQRSIKGSILTPCHFYISTLVAEKASVAKIDMLKTVGVTVETNQYMGI